jgi:hypothetical protein
VLLVCGFSLRVERRRWGWVLAPLALGVLLALGANGDLMGRSRLLLPGVAGSLLLAAELGEARAPSAGELGITLPIALAASLLLPRFMQLPEVRRLSPSLAASTPPLEASLVWLATHAPRDALIQSADIGMLGHLPFARIVDARGLTSSRFRQAKRQGISGLSSFYAGAQAPDIIQVSRFAPAGLLPDGLPAPTGLDPWLSELTPALTRYTDHEDLRFHEAGWVGVSRFWWRAPLDPPPASLVRERFATLAARFPSIPRFAELARNVPNASVAAPR